MDRRGMDRRTFLGTMTAATVLSRQLAWAAGDHKIEKVGLQLYTIRSVMKDDFEGKLARVSAIGYREVEFAGYDGHTPQEIRAMLDRHGLTGQQSLERVPRILRFDERGTLTVVQAAFVAQLAVFVENEHVRSGFGAIGAGYGLGVAVVQVR